MTLAPAAPTHPGSAAVPAAAYSLGSRDAHLDRLRHEVFDLVVVGGGITGAGVAWDAAARGLRVGLVEQADFAGGTSSRSSKLIHGGLRYLAQGRLALTREAVHERGRLQRLAPHLVQSLPFVYPIYRGPLEWAKLTAGLWLYDAFAAGSGARRHTWLGRDETLAAAPGLSPQRLAGGFVYRDARTDDARLVLEALRGATAHGAAIANHVSMQGLLETKGNATGIAVHDHLGGGAFDVRARRVVLATGVWLDRVVPAEPDGGVRVRPAKGVHLYLPAGLFPSDTALYLATPSDGRLIFVVPWQGRTLVGTTDTEYRGDLAAPRATAEDVRYLLEAVNRAFPQRRLTPDDVISTQAGLRPLIALGDGATGSLSREDRVFEMDTGAIGIAGGKLTTFRRMAAKVVDLAARRMDGPHSAGESRTAALPLSGFARPMDGAAYAAWREAALGDVRDEGRAIRARLIERYGAHYTAVEDLIRDDSSLAAPLTAGAPVLKAEALFAIRHEMAASVADVLSQRLRLTLLCAGGSGEAAAAVAGMLARELRWTEHERTAALQAYGAEVTQYAVPQ